MIDYTRQLSVLIRDLIERVPGLGLIDADRVLVFARPGASGSAGPFATCHCLTMPPSDPGYYYWLDRSTGRMTRRSLWFVTESPTVTVGGRRIEYLISFALPRFCDQSLEHSAKRAHYPGMPASVARLDTIVHELYHIDPSGRGLRTARRADGCESATMHGCRFHHEVASMVRAYLASDADPDLRAFLEYDFAALVRRFGGVVATTFRTFPSFPQRYPVPLAVQPKTPECDCIQPIRLRTRPTVYSDSDLVVREFTGARAVSVPRRRRAACGPIAGISPPAALTSHRRPLTPITSRLPSTPSRRA
jgi:hypothetical protein